MKSLLLVLCVGCINVSWGQVPLVYETFDGGIPADWTLVNNDGNTPHPDVSEYTDAWIVVADPDDALNSVVSSTSYFQPVDRADRWLIMPNVTLGGSGNFISWYGKSHDPSFPDSYKVLISNSGTNSSDFTDTLVMVTNESPDWTFHQVEIEQFVNENVHIAFVLTTFNGFKLYLDSIDLRKEDPLFVPTVAANYEVKLFPNPATDYISIHGEGIHSVSCLSADGKQMFTIDTPNNIDVSAIASGVYVLIIEHNQGVLRKKLIKQ
jgi:hypothetical protein